MIVRCLLQHFHAKVNETKFIIDIKLLGPVVFEPAVLEGSNVDRDCFVVLLGSATAFGEAFQSDDLPIIILG